ncbi:MAG TPA: LysR substrate-binding domain-containing protein, partial [Polyangiaceae bacterium]|nr:LysR substrate-binding domain-containing protein [Polyangiaceae bacterium]
PLLVRSGSTMTLTPRAVALYPAVERGLSELRATITGEPPFEPRTAGRVFTVGAVDYGQSLLLPPLLAFLEREAPRIDLAVVNAPDLFELLENGRIDLAIVVGPTVPSAFRSRELFTDGFVCMVRRGHPVARRKLTLARYLELRHVVVAPTGSPGSVVDTELAKRGKQRRVALRVPDFLVAPLVVSNSDFINTVPGRLATLHAKHHPVRLFPPPIPLPRFSICLAWHARLDADPAHVWLRNGIVRVARDV